MLAYAVKNAADICIVLKPPQGKLITINGVVILSAYKLCFKEQCKKLLACFSSVHSNIHRFPARACRACAA